MIEVEGYSFDERSRLYLSNSSSLNNSCISADNDTSIYQTVTRDFLFVGKYEVPSPCEVVKVFYDIEKSFL